MMNIHERFIESELKREPYLVGSELSRRLEKRFRITADNARKIAQRAALRGIVNPSIITFGRNQFAYIHPSKKFTREIILEIAYRHRPALYRLIAMLTTFKGILPYHEAMKVAATPLDSKKAKSDSLPKLISELELLSYARKFETLDGKRFIIDPARVDKAEAGCRVAHTSMETDVTFIPDILRTLQRHNIIDNNKVLYRSRTSPEVSIHHSNYAWDAIGYTKTTGINPGQSSKATTLSKQTLVVIDIVITRPYTEHDVKGFLARIQGSQNAVVGNKRKVLPVVVFSSLQTTKLKSLIRTLGFLSFDLGSVYGSHIYAIVEKLLAVKKARFVPVETVIDETLEIIKSAGQDNNLANLKGDLFESLMFPVLELHYSDATIEHGKKLKSIDKSDKREIPYDYIINSPRTNEVLVVELKGYSSMTTIPIGDDKQQSTLKWFFENTFQFAQRRLREENKNARITACFITTSKFDSNGLEFLASRSEGNLKPSNLDLFYDGTKLIELLTKHNLTTTRGIIQKYFFVQSDDSNP